MCFFAPMCRRSHNIRRPFDGLGGLRYEKWVEAQLYISGKHEGDDMVGRQMIYFFCVDRYPMVTVCPGAKT
jgi:hypothetical protein